MLRSRKPSFHVVPPHCIAGLSRVLALPNQRRGSASRQHLMPRALQAAVQEILALTPDDTRHLYVTILTKLAGGRSLTRPDIRPSWQFATCNALAHGPFLDFDCLRHPEMRKSADGISIAFELVSDRDVGSYSGRWSNKPWLSSTSSGGIQNL